MSVSYYYFPIIDSFISCFTITISRTCGSLIRQQSEIIFMKVDTNILTQIYTCSFEDFFVQILLFLSIFSKLS